jgi:signal peptidase
MIKDIFPWPFKNDSYYDLHILIITYSHGEQYLLTKGDNNPIDDRGLYNEGQMYISRQDVMGVVKGYLPHMGLLTILLNDIPQLKLVFVAILALVVIFQRDE